MGGAASSVERRARLGLSWLQSPADAVGPATALLVPAAALGVVAIVVRPVVLIVSALVLGAALMVGGMLVGF